MAHSFRRRMQQGREPSPSSICPVHLTKAGICASALTPPTAFVGVAVGVGVRNFVATASEVGVGVEPVGREREKTVSVMVGPLMLAGRILGIGHGLNKWKKPYFPSEGIKSIFICLSVRSTYFVF